MEHVNKKILLLSTSDINGANEAIYKICFFLKQNGFQVAMVVRYKTRHDDFIYSYTDFSNTSSLASRLVQKVKDRIRVKVLNKKIVYDPNYLFLSADERIKNISSELLLQRIPFTPDVIMTGMTQDFLNSTDLLGLQKLTKAQVYNITVDMNHFTGGCHYAWDCKGYITGCTSNCPAIVSSYGKDTAKINFETKLSNAKAGNFKVITGSGWTYDQARKSKIYKDQETIININSFIDTDLLNNKSRHFAKAIFGLEEDKFYILMGCQNASEPRKGFEYLLESLIILDKKLSETQKAKIEVLIVSRKNSDSFSKIPFAKKHIDFIKDYRLLSLLYQASDVFVNSSIEDSGPMMVSEALACGTPVVGFDMGVVNNMVINDYNGYKAILKDSQDLAVGIERIVNLSKEAYSNYSLNAVRQIEEFSSMNYAKDEFKKIINI